MCIPQKQVQIWSRLCKTLPASRGRTRHNLPQRLFCSTSAIPSHQTQSRAHFPPSSSVQDGRQTWAIAQTCWSGQLHPSIT